MRPLDYHDQDGAARAVFLNPESADSIESAEGSGWVRKHEGQTRLL